MTESDTNSMTKEIVAKQVPDQNKISDSNVTYPNANPVDASRSFGSSITRTVVVDAAEQFEGHRDSTSSSLIPGVNDVTQGVQDVVRNAKNYVRIFRIDNEIFDVNQEQLDRMRMSKCETKVGTGWLVALSREEM
jgi:hypothetical protein